MKLSPNVKTKAEGPLSAALLVLVLLILSLLGPIPMFLGSAIGLAAYPFLFREQWRGRPWFRVLMLVVAAVLVGAAIGLASGRGPSH
jgi:hypothetical protein